MNVRIPMGRKYKHHATRASLPTTASPSDDSVTKLIHAFHTIFSSCRTNYLCVYFQQSRHLRMSHDNPVIKKLYEEYLEKPGSHKAHELLHTTYVKRFIN